MKALFGLAAAALTLFTAPVLAVGLADLSNKDAVAAMKQALTKGSQSAVQLLARQGGFLGNERVRIPLPESLHKAEGLMRGLGMGNHADELITTMNRAAEIAVVEAKPLLVNAVRNMSVQDAKGILTGGEDAATQYFKRSSSTALSDKFLPIVKNATQRVKLTDKYNEFAGKGARFGLINQEEANLNDYVTRKTLDGLFLMIAEEEKKIRMDPVGSASSIIAKVFGAIGK